ncbi:uncharacterized protein LOC101860881 [Aplysia californica]|uniref:Uncharacterized protein LOC101860881 n=1 Tax=Aplysia californica TaxID=6500 RepID=A0ABM0ZWI5_APLCA|nr:uncharacterized protein LOC101860881 [Aplysia californica]
MVATVHGIVRPSYEFQSRLLNDVYTEFNIDVKDIVCFEAHGACNRKDDEAELKAIDAVICSRRRDPLIVSSVKGNIGHTEATSGLASIVKCIISFQTKIIYNCVNFQVPNPASNALKSGRIVIPTSNFPVPENPNGLMAVSSFGFGGLGGHAVLRRCPDTVTQIADCPMLIPLTLQPYANFQDAAIDILRHMGDPSFYRFFLNSELSKGNAMWERSFFIVNSDKGSLQYFDVSSMDPVVTPVCVVFTDMISSPWSPSKDLMNIPSVRQTFELCDQEVIKLKPDRDGIPTMLESIKVPSPIETGGLTLRLSCQIALIELLKAMGALDKVALLRGEGVGGLAVAYADRCLSLAQCIRVALAMEEILVQENVDHQDTTLMKVSVDEDTVHQLGPWVRVLKKLEHGKYFIAVLHGKKNTVIQKLKEKGHTYEVLKFCVPIYCHNQDRLKDNLKTRFQKIIPRPAIWSAKSEVAGLKPRGNGVQTCSPEFLATLLSGPWDEDSVKEMFVEEKRIKTSSSMTNYSPWSEESVRGNLLSKPEDFYSEDHQMDLDSIRNDGFVDREKREFLVLKCFESSVKHEPMFFLEEELRCSGADRSDREVREIQPNSEGFLTTLGRIHVAGHRIEATRQLSMVETQPSMFTGYFPTDHLYGWTRTAHCETVDWTRTRASQRLPKTMCKRIFPPEYAAVSDPPGVELVHILLSSAAEFFEKDLQKGQVLAFDNVRLAHVTSIDTDHSDPGSVLCKVSAASKKFVVERVGSLSLLGSLEVYSENPVPEEYSFLDQVSRFPKDRSLKGLLKDMLSFLMNGYHELWPLRLIWDPSRHSKLCAARGATLQCSLGFTAGLMTCGGLIIQSHPSKGNSFKISDLCCPNPAECSSEAVSTEPLETDEQLILSRQTPSLSLRKTLKQVRFSPDQIFKIQNVKAEVPLTPGPVPKSGPKDRRKLHEEHASKKSVIFDFTQNLNNQCHSSAMERDRILEKSEENAMGLSDICCSGNLAIRADLGIMLMDILDSWPQGTSLHVYVVPPESPISEAPYVIYLLRQLTPSKVKDNDVAVLLRDRSTDLIEECHGVNDCLSMMSSFIEDLFVTHKVRLFAIKASLDHGLLSILEWEPLLLKKEMLSSKRMEKTISSEDSKNHSVCSMNDEEESKSCVLGDGETFHVCGMQYLTQLWRKNTIFSLELDDMFVKTLTKLTTINNHIVGFVVPQTCRDLDQSCDREHNENTIFPTSTERSRDDSRIFARLRSASDNMFDLPNGKLASEIHLTKTKSTSFDEDDIFEKMTNSSSDFPLFLMSVRNKGRGGKKSGRKKILSYLYCKNPKEILSFKNLDEMVSCLSQRFPGIKATHDVLFSQLTRETDNFDELLYHFWESDKCRDFSSSSLSSSSIYWSMENGSPFEEVMTPQFKDCPSVTVTPPKEAATFECPETVWDGSVRVAHVVDGSSCFQGLNVPDKENRRKACWPASETTDNTSKTGTPYLSKQNNTDIKIINTKDECSVPEISKSKGLEYSEVINSDYPEAVPQISCKNGSVPHTPLFGVLDACNRTVSDTAESHANYSSEVNNHVYSKNITPNTSENNSKDTIDVIAETSTDILGISDTESKSTSSDSAFSTPEMQKQSGNENEQNSKIIEYETQHFEYNKTTKEPCWTMSPDSTEKSTSSGNACNGSDVGALNIRRNDTSPVIVPFTSVCSAMDILNNKATDASNVGEDKAFISSVNDIGIIKIYDESNCKTPTSSQVKTKTSATVQTIENPAEHAVSNCFFCESSREKKDYSLPFTDNFEHSNPLASASSTVTSYKQVPDPSLIQNQSATGLSILQNQPASDNLETQDNSESEPSTRLASSENIEKENSKTTLCFAPVFLPSKDDKSNSGTLPKSSKEFRNEEEQPNVNSLKHSSAPGTAGGQNIATFDNACFLSTIAYESSEDKHSQQLISSVRIALIVQLYDRTGPEDPVNKKAMGHLLLYLTECEKEQGGDAYLGLVLVDNGKPSIHSRFRVNKHFSLSHLENVLNVIFALHILRDLGRLNSRNISKKTVLVQPPLYKDSGVMLLVAHHLGCKFVISASNLTFVIEELRTLMPRCIMLRDSVSSHNVRPLTDGQGCDVVIMFQPRHELFEFLSLVKTSGSVVLCGNVDSERDIGLSVFLRNISLHCVDAKHVVQQTMTMSPEKHAEFENLMEDTMSSLNDTISNLYPSGVEGYFYRVLGKVLELSPDHRPSEKDLLNSLFVGPETASHEYGNCLSVQTSVVCYIAERLLTPAPVSSSVIPSVFSPETADVSSSHSTPGPANLMEMA